MDSDNIMKRTILLNAKPSKVWDALKDPKMTKKFMFNCEAHSSWEIGSPIVWKGNFQGYESGEKGIILNYEKEKQLQYSSIDPNFGIEDIPENYLHITYDLSENGEGTELKMTIENFNNDPERIINVAKGWDNVILPALAKLFNENK